MFFCQSDWREKASRGAARRHANSSEFQKTRRRPDSAGVGTQRSPETAASGAGPRGPRERSGEAWALGPHALKEEAAFCRLTPGPRARCFLPPISSVTFRIATEAVAQVSVRA
jgi:hypothetical protein